MGVYGQTHTSNTQVRTTTTTTTRRLTQAFPCPVYPLVRTQRSPCWVNATLPAAQEVPAGEGSDDSARGPNTSGYRSPWRCLRCPTTRSRWAPRTTLYGARSLSTAQEGCGRLLSLRAGRRSGYSGAPWSRSPTQCRWSHCSSWSSRRWWFSWWTCSVPLISVLPSRLSRCPRLSVHPALHAQSSVHRRQRNNWWKYRRSYPFLLLCSGSVEQIVDIPASTRGVYGSL